MFVNDFMLYLRVLLYIHKAFRLRRSGDVEHAVKDVKSDLVLFSHEQNGLYKKHGYLIKKNI